MNLAYFKYLVFALAIGASLLAGCKKDDPDDPETQKKLTPTITVDASTVADNKEFIIKDGVPGSFTVKFVANKGPEGKDLQTFIIRQLADNVPLAEKTKTISGGTFSWDSTFETTTRTPSTVKFTFVIKDKDGKEASFSRTYTTKAEGTPITTPEFKEASLHNNYPYLISPKGTVINIGNGEASKNDIDITYFYSGVSGHNLTSPVARNNSTLYGEFAITWGTIATEFRSTTLSKSRFDALKNEDQASLAAEFNSGSPTQVAGGNSDGSRATSIAKEGKGGQIKNGTVFAFRNNKDSKYGLIYIANVNTDGVLGINIETLRQK